MLNILDSRKIFVLSVNLNLAVGGRSDGWHNVIVVTFTEQHERFIKISLRFVIKIFNKPDNAALKSNRIYRTP